MIWRGHLHSVSGALRAERKPHSARSFCLVQNVGKMYRLAGGERGILTPETLCGIPKSPNLRAILEGLTEQNRSSTGLAVRRESSLCVSLGGQSPRS
jgi:hypothetical protein